jgi:hypothetical protein
MKNNLVSLLLLAIGWPLTSIAQSSDEIRYYILYDKSGSVPKVDRNENLSKMLGALIERKDLQIKASTKFTILPFGATIEKNENTLIYDPQSPNSDSVSKLIEKINSITDYKITKKELLTNIHTALEELLTTITNDKSSGIFIFTDGILNSGDYTIGVDALKQPPAYYKFLQELQEKIRLKTGKPVFLVQVSNTPTNPYFPPIEHLSLKLDKPIKLINDSTVFWLKNTEVYNPNKPNSDNVKAFADFIARANDMIVRSEPTFNSIDDLSIDKAVLLNNIIELGAVTHAMKEVVTGSIPNSEMLFNLIDNTRPPEPKDVIDSLFNKAKLEVGTDKLRIIKTFIDQASIIDLQKTLKILQADAVASKQLTPAKLVNLINVGVGSQAFKAAEPTLNTLATQAKGIKSAEKQIISGVTDYIIERGKQEALYLLMERMNERILKPNQPLQELLPELTTILADSSNYYDVTLLKETFSRDFRMLPDNVQQSGIFKESESLTGMIAMINLFKNITENQSIELAFRQFSEDVNTLQVNDRKIIDAVKFTANVIGYLTTNDLASVFSDKPKLEILSKLIVVLSIDESTLEKIDNIDLNNAADLVRNIYLQYRLVKSQIEVFNEQIIPSADFDGYRRMRDEAVTDILNRSSDLLFSGFPVLASLKYKVQEKVDKAENYQKLWQEVRRIKDGYFLIRERKYTQAALLLSPEIMVRVNAKFREVVEETDKKYLKHQDIANKVLTISAEVSDAQSPDAVKAILTKYALPVASYRIKHNTSPNFMISAYLGAGAAYFLNFKENDDNVFPVITAPIGLDWSFKKFLGMRRVSLFASIIDVGNVVSYKLWSKNNANEDDILKLNQIVSPGLFFAWSLNKKLPLTINTGYAFNPSRISVSLNFDMPLFAIYRGR